MAARSTLRLFGILGSSAAALLVSFTGCGESTGDSTSTGTSSAQGGDNSGGNNDKTSWSATATRSGAATAVAVV